jgi:2-keto-4-pentenoate hydratase/2-oxohepta-3-ene-1,7-dioic acid hydratase in catechol pathway
VRFVSYRRDGACRPGLIVDGLVVDLQATAEAYAGTSRTTEIASLRKALALGPARLGELATVAGEQLDRLSSGGHASPIEGVKLGPPVPDPQKIICLGLNYRDHAEEAGLRPPATPMFFAKFANSLVGPEDPVIPPPHTDAVDYEAELAVVIGRRGHRIQREEALSYVAGVMAFNDVSARDLQLANPLWTGGKAIDTFAPCGPALVTLDEVGNLQDLRLCTRVNGSLVQDGTTSSMIFAVDETISFLSQLMTLEPGDIIATGTPAGVGNARSPKLFLSAGDVVEVELPGVGRLRNTIAREA